MNTLPNCGRPGHGFSLVEVLVAMVLGVFLVLGVTQIVSVSRGLYQSNAAIARMQENGRFALSVLTRNIRMAGFTGCSRDLAVTNKLSNYSTIWWKNFATSATATTGGSIMGYDGGQAFPGFPNLGSPPDVQFFPSTDSYGKRISGTDALMILGGDGGYTVTGRDNATLTLSSLTKPSGVTLASDGILVACDTNSSDTSATLFQVTSVAGKVITIGASGAPPPLGSLNTTPLAQISLLDYVPTAFYIGRSSSGAVTNSLWQLQFNGSSMQPQELAEGVRNMQLHYGEDDPSVSDPTATGLPDGVVDVYRDATSVLNWNNVLAVRISLLMVTLDDNVAPQPQSYLLPADTGDASKAGRTSTATDRRLYQTFAATVGIRNRLRLE